jgi:MFS family permease
LLVVVGEETLTPAALSMLADVFPAARLGLATGIYYAGIPLGTAMSLVVAGWMAPRYGWRACFYVLGIAGLVFAAWMAFVRDPRGSRLAHEEAPHRGIAPPAPASQGILPTLGRTIVQVPTYTLAILGGSLLAYGSAAALHAITWLVQERQMPFATAAFTAGIIAVASGFLGNLAGGWFADACQRRMRAGRLWSLVMLTAGCTPFAITFYSIEPGTLLFYGCWFVASAATTAYFGPLFAIVQEVSPVRIRSTSVAFALLGLNLLGVGPGPWITGIIGDHASLTRGLLVSTVVACCSIVPFALAARTYERDVARARAL